MSSHNGKYEHMVEDKKLVFHSTMTTNYPQWEENLILYLNSIPEFSSDISDAIKARKIPSEWLEDYVPPDELASPLIPEFNTVLPALAPQVPVPVPVGANDAVAVPVGAQNPPPVQTPPVAPAPRQMSALRQKLEEKKLEKIPALQEAWKKY